VKVIFSSLEETGVEEVGTLELVEDFAASEEEVPPCAQLSMRKDEVKTKRPVSLKCFLSIVTSKHLHAHYKPDLWLKMISEKTKSSFFSFIFPNNKLSFSLVN
jgi:hypothetical protein